MSQLARAVAFLRAQSMNHIRDSYLHRLCGSALKEAADIEEFKLVLDGARLEEPRREVHVPVFGTCAEIAHIRCFLRCLGPISDSIKAACCNYYFEHGDCKSYDTRCARTYFHPQKSSLVKAVLLNLR